jgi:putative intracellular protease/amidase
MTATVCTGTALLARTGLLDGRPPTSNKLAWEWVKQQGEAADWVRRARWVDEGDMPGVRISQDKPFSVRS